MLLSVLLTVLNISSKEQYSEYNASPYNFKSILQYSDNVIKLSTDGKYFNKLKFFVHNKNGSD
jgi:hypothetical protein